MVNKLILYNAYHISNALDVPCLVKLPEPFEAELQPMVAKNYKLTH